MTTNWTIAIDWDHDGDYTDTYDDVTDRIISANWFLGMRQPYQEIEDGSRLTLKLSNADCRYSPEYSSSPLNGKVRPHKPVRIQSNDGSTTRTHWLGWIEAIKPCVGEHGKRRVRRKCGCSIYNGPQTSNILGVCVTSFGAWVNQNGGLSPPLPKSARRNVAADFIRR